MVYSRPGFEWQDVDFIQLILLTIYCNIYINLSRWWCLIKLRKKNFDLSVSLSLPGRILAAGELMLDITVGDEHCYSWVGQLYQPEHCILVRKQSFGS